MLACAAYETPADLDAIEVILAAGAAHNTQVLPVSMQKRPVNRILSLLRCSSGLRLAMLRLSLAISVYDADAFTHVLPIDLLEELGSRWLQSNMAVKVRVARHMLDQELVKAKLEALVLPVSANTRSRQKQALQKVSEV